MLRAPLEMGGIQEFFVPIVPTTAAVNFHGARQRSLARRPSKLPSTTCEEDICSFHWQCSFYCGQRTTKWAIGNRQHSGTTQQIGVVRFRRAERMNGWGLFDFLFITSFMPCVITDQVHIIRNRLGARTLMGRAHKTRKEWYLHFVYGHAEHWE